MPCQDLKMEKEISANLSLVMNDGQLVPVVRIKPTELSLIDNRNGAPDDRAGGDESPTTIWYIAPEPEDGKTGEERVHQPTITVTTTAMERVTLTVTMAPSTLASFPAVPRQVETVTTTVTATVTPMNQICMSMTLAIGIPLICVMGTGAFMLGIYILFWRRNIRNHAVRRETVAALGGYSDGSSDGSTASLTAPRPIHGGGGGGGLRSGIDAPPSSIASQPGGPFADPALRDAQAPAHRVPQESANNNQSIRNQRASNASNYSSVAPSYGPNTEVFLTRRGSRAGSNRTGYLRRRNDSEAATSGNVPSGRNSGDVAWRFGTSFIFPTGPVIRPAPASRRRLTEVIGRFHPSLRASIIETLEDEFQESEIPSASAVPDTQDRANVAELEGSPVPRRFSATIRARDEGVASTVSDESDARTLGRDSPFELSADNPVHEPGTEGAIAAPAETEQEAGKNSDKEDGAAEDDSKDGDKAGQSAEPSAKQ